MELLQVTLRKVARGVQLFQYGIKRREKQKDEPFVFTICLFHLANKNYIGRSWSA